MGAGGAGARAAARHGARDAAALLLSGRAAAGGAAGEQGTGPLRRVSHLSPETCPTDWAPDELEGRRVRSERGQSQIAAVGGAWTAKPLLHGPLSAAEQRCVHHLRWAAAAQSAPAAGISTVAAWRLADAGSNRRSESTAGGVGRPGPRARRRRLDPKQARARPARMRPSLVRSPRPRPTGPPASGPSRLRGRQRSTGKRMLYMRLTYTAIQGTASPSRQLSERLRHATHIAIALSMVPLCV